MATCGLCESKGIHGHWALKRSIQDEFRSELMRAQHEYQRLLALFREVTWYHFELLARKWRTPWHVTYIYIYIYAVQIWVSDRVTALIWEGGTA